MVVIIMEEGGKEDLPIAIKTNKPIRKQRVNKKKDEVTIYYDLESSQNHPPQ